MKIAIGCDPNAQKEKEEVIAFIEKKGYGTVEDFGSEDSIYANVAIKVSEAVASRWVRQRNFNLRNRNRNVHLRK